MLREKGSNLLNKQDEYNRCLLQTMIKEGPKSIKHQKQDQRDQNIQALTKGQEEEALNRAKVALKKRIREVEERRREKRRRVEDDSRDRE